MELKMRTKPNLIDKALEALKNFWISHKIKNEKTKERVQKQPTFLLVLVVIGAWALGIYFNAFFADIWPEYVKAISNSHLQNWGLLEVTATLFVLLIKAAAIYYPAEKTFFLAAVRAKASKPRSHYGKNRSSDFR
jgi:hypothetical protein